jgi:hypothetical protein
MLLYWLLHHVFICYISIVCIEYLFKSTNNFFPNLFLLITFNYSRTTL